MASPTRQKKEVEAAAKAANVHDFITGLPNGYKTELGERGAKISGGERQRIAVARAFLRDAPILILDEPTSSIDSRTESVILDALDRLMEGRTTIVIAHRLSTLRSVDKILVLNEGRIVEQGTHDELLADGGLYKQLWEAQTGPERRPQARWQRRPSPAGSRRRKSREESAAGVAPAVARDRHRGRPRCARSRAARPRPRRRRGRRSSCSGCSRKIPVGGAAWLVGQYATGFERLGYEVYYVEAHARTPTMFMTPWARRRHRQGRQRTSAKIAERFGLADRWAFQALHEQRPLLRDECRAARPPLPRRGADHQHARRHPAAARARRDRSPRLPRDRPSQRRAGGRPRATERATRVPRPARCLLHLGPQLRKPRLLACPGRGATSSSRARHPWCSTSGRTMSSPTVRPSRRSGTGASPTATSGTGAGSTGGASTSSSSRSSTCR